MSIGSKGPIKGGLKFGGGLSSTTSISTCLDSSKYDALALKAYVLQCQCGHHYCLGGRKFLLFRRNSSLLIKIDEEVGQPQKVCFIQKKQNPMAN
jgi:hypothetical protein